MKRVKAFDVTMAEITYPMPLPQRFFSKVIHAKIVSSISDIIGGTIARPNALLLGGICSFLVTLITYLVAKNLGYSLSGLESLSAFLLGWLCGILVDLGKFVLTRRR